MKSSSKKTIIICVSVVLILAVLATIFFVLLPNKKVEKTIKVGFYEIDERTKLAIQTEFENLAKINLIEENIIEFIDFDTNLSLKENVENAKNVSVVFSYNGESQKSIAKKTVALDSSKIAMMPENIKKLNKNCLPILVNNIELCAMNTFYNDLGNDVNYLDGVLSGLNTQETKNTYSVPITVPARDDKVLSLFVSAWLESRYGIEELNKVRNYIIQNEGKNLFVADLLENKEFASFKAVVDELVELKKNGILHSQWQNMIFDDVENFMATKSTAVAFMTTDLHRLVEYYVINKYTDSFFPVCLTNKKSNFCFVMPVVVATCFDERCKSIVEGFASLETQENLSFASGLAPTSSFAETADKQATNVRFWAASAKEIALSLDSAFTIPAEKKKFFADLRSYL